MQQSACQRIMRSDAESSHKVYQKGTGRATHSNRLPHPNALRWAVVGFRDASPPQIFFLALSATFVADSAKKERREGRYISSRPTT
jgi:hypothetical protein